MKYKLTQLKNGNLGKIVRSDDYNFNFDCKTGQFMRWGATPQDDPEWARYGPEIADIEISTICNAGCKFCYKGNTGCGQNMSLNTFKEVFDKLPDHLTQIAFGIGDMDSNPDLWDIMNYSKKHNVVPNITVNGKNMTDEHYDKLAVTCGAVAVSLYDYDECYNTVKELTDRGMDQVNIHCLLSDETYEKCLKVMYDYKNDSRLSKLNAIVFLWLKPKGRAVGNMNQLKSQKHYKYLVDYAFEYEVPIGFDSCSAPMFVDAIKDRPDFKRLYDMCEPCESTLFSMYINVEGKAMPCSFSDDAFAGVDVAKCDDFINDVWNSAEFRDFRQHITNNKDENGCRNCPLYKLGCKNE
jgi:radical SAM protein with 4Fe4S-binding SPASM domain